MIRLLGFRGCETWAPAANIPTIPSGTNSARAWPSPGTRSFSSGILGSLFGDGKTVIRGGYGRIFGRLNGVNLVLVPLLGVGLLQPVTCPGAVQHSRRLAANAGTNVAIQPPPSALERTETLRRSPLYRRPCLNPISRVLMAMRRRRRREHARSELSAGAHRQLHLLHPARDRHQDDARAGLHRAHHPERDAGDQPGCCAVHDHLERPKLRASIRRIPISPSAAQPMLRRALQQRPASVPTQPFFEAALGGANSAYCKGFASCTAAVASNNASSVQKHRRYPKSGAHEQRAFLDTGPHHGRCESNANDVDRA